MAVISLWMIFFIGAVWTGAASTEDNPIEVGEVNWQRDYEAALGRSRESGKPVLLFFQEVPGCIGCQNFGQQVLTNPLLVEAVEDEFIPVLVYNNRLTGMDARLLKQFGEPSWNYQVIRFIDAEQRDVIPRRDRIWDLAGIAARMAAALEAVGRPVPNYLRAVATEHDKDNIRTAVFAMSCFWTGEYQLGSIEGVVTTEAGFYQGREVTMVSYDQEQLALEQLIEQAAARRCAQSVYIENYSAAVGSSLKVKQFDRSGYRRAPLSDQKKQIQRWLKAHGELQLSQMQLTKLNALMPDDREAAASWLSPRQLAQTGHLQ
ncbi:MAG: VPGUxxT family thioredoxin-like (seleno)protein, type 2 [Desulfocapsaceae bacterium]